MPDTKVSDLTAITTPAPATDLFYIVQSGPVSRKVTVLTYFSNYVAGQSANAFTVGRQGSTDPALKVNTNTASCVTGIEIIAAAAAGRVAVAVISSGANEGLDLDAKGSGTVRLGATSTGDVVLGRSTTVAGTLTGTSANASALTYGRQGATNPALQVDASTALCVTGIKITAGILNGAVFLEAISSGNDESLRINAKGAGVIHLGTDAANNTIQLSRDTVLGGRVTFNATGFIDVVIGGIADNSTLSLRSTSGGGTTDAILFQVGTNGGVEAGRVTTAGLWQIKAGGSTSTGKLGCTLNVQTNSVGNVGTGDDDLHSYSVPAATLNVNGDSLTFEAAGTIANNVNAKRIRVKFGATTIFDTGAAGIPVSAAIDWAIEGRIIRTGATTQKCAVRLSTSNSTLAAYTDYATAAETLSGAVTLKVTAEATSNDDVVEELFHVSWQSAP